jgi:hypothetical protein
MLRSNLVLLSFLLLTSFTFHSDSDSPKGCDNGNLESLTIPLSELSEISQSKIREVKRPPFDFLERNAHSSVPLLNLAPNEKQYFEVEMKVLLLSATSDTLIEPELTIAIKALQSFGITYDHKVLTQDSDLISRELLSLEENNGVGKYYAIVLTTGLLVFQNKERIWNSALTQDQWTQLEDYERRFHIRRVSLSTWPTPAIGLTVAGTPGSDNNDVIMANNLGPYTSGMVPELRTSLSYTWQTPAKILDSSKVKPVFYFGNKVENEKPLAAAIINFSDHREQMHFFFVQSQYSMPSLLAIPIWLRWVTGNIYMGKRRVYLNVQVDDFFLNTDRWSPYLSKNPGDGSRNYRLRPEDLDYFVKYRHENLISLSGDPNFKIDLAFNGFGVWEARGYKKDALFMQAKKLTNEYNWISHTYSHMDLNLFNYERAMDEFNKNTEMAKDIFGSEEHPSYSRKSMVTPRISGLFVPGVLKAMVDSQILYVAGDTTRPEITPGNMYVGRWTTKEQNGFEGVLIIPRAATEIYYDVTDTIELSSEYNHRYRKYFGRDLSYQEIYQRESDRVVRSLLRLEPIPNMFHVTNLRAFLLPEESENKNRVSLISLWLDAVLAEYRKYSTLPVRALKFDNLAEIFIQRMDYEKCGARSYLTFKDRKPISLKSNSEKKCIMNITTGTEVEIDIEPESSSPNEVKSELYGPDKTTTYTMDTNNSMIFKIKIPENGLFE